MFRSVILLKGSHLETVPENKGPSRSLHVVLNENPVLLKECVNGELGQP